MNSIITLSKNTEHKLLFEKICGELDLNLNITSNCMDFILEAERKEYQSFFIDGSLIDDNIKLVQILKNIRPRIPIVFITDNNDKINLQKLYNEGIFYVYLTPLNKEILTEVIKSSIVCKIKNDNILNKLYNH